MKPLLYSELVPWYRLLDPTEDHREEAGIYDALLQRGAPGAATMLELGSGGGNNAAFLKQRYACTLVDLSEAMLSISRELNPECEHVHGDMRAVRLRRTFDVVLVHDAIGYMASRQDLRAAIETVSAHLRPGGAALLTPDCLADTWAESSQLHAGDDGARSLRCIEWTWDPDPSDEQLQTDFAFLLRDGAEVTAVHDRHVTGLFDRDTWLALCREAGLAVEVVTRPVGDAGPGLTDEVFLCRKPAGELP